MTSTRMSRFGWRAGVVGLQRALFFAAISAWIVSTNLACRDEAARIVVSRDAAAVAQRANASQVTVVNADALADLLKASRGNVLVVNFWATWCKPCADEMPAFVGFYQEHTTNPNNGVTFISVSADAPGSLKQNVEPFLRKYGVPFPVNVIDAESPDEVVEGLDLKDTGWDGALPATFVFDASGLIRKAWFTEVTQEELTQTIRDVLARTA